MCPVKIDLMNIDVKHDSVRSVYCVIDYFPLYSLYFGSYTWNLFDLIVPNMPTLTYFSFC